MNHTDKLVLLPMERYELLKRLSRPSDPEKMSPEKRSKLEEKVEEKVEKVPEKRLERAVETSPRDTEKALLSTTDVINSMKTGDRKYAAHILRRMDSSLWDGEGILTGLGLPVRDLIHDLKNSAGGQLITDAKRRNIRHFIYKHTSISPSMITNPKYARTTVAKKDSTSRFKKQWLDHV